MKTQVWRLIFIGSILFAPASSMAQTEKFFEIKAKKFSYTPNFIKVKYGDNVRIRLLSEDVHHGLFIDGYNIRTSAYPGQEGNLKFVADKTGRFSFRCSVTCGEFHPYMVGYLIVGPNTRFYFFVGLTLVFFLLGIIALLVPKKKINLMPGNSSEGK